MRIGTHLSGFEMQMLNQLWQANLAAQANSLRLATGKKVSSPSDDPAAFVQMSGMQSQLDAVNDTVTRIDAASTMAAQAQLTVDQIGTQLGEIRSKLLEDESGGLTSEERLQAQVEIDALVSNIDDLASTEISGRRLLDGTANYAFAGRSSSQIRQLDIYALGNGAPEISGTVTQAAGQATLDYPGKGGSRIKDDADFTLTGTQGSANFSVSRDDDLDDVADEINLQSHNTGVTADVSGNTLTFTSVDYGDDATIAIEVTSGTFAVTGGNGDGTASGTDVEVTLNGESVAASQISGNRAIYASDGFHFRMEFAEGFSGDFDTVTVSSGGSLQFDLSPDASHRTTLALPSLLAARLGGVSGELTDLVSGGSLSGLGDNTSQAIRVVDEALSRLALVEAQVDSFADITVASASALMSGFSASLDSDGDGIVDLNESDEQTESALLTKNQGLAANALASLSIAQQQQQGVLALLYGIAGLS